MTVVSSLPALRFAGNAARVCKDVIQSHDVFVK